MAALQADLTREVALEKQEKQADLIGAARGESLPNTRQHDPQTLKTFESSIRVRLEMAGVLNRTSLIQAAARHEMLPSGMARQHGNQHGLHGLAAWAARLLQGRIA